MIEEHNPLNQKGNMHFVIYDTDSHQVEKVLHSMEEVIDWFVSPLPVDEREKWINDNQFSIDEVNEYGSSDFCGMQVSRVRE